jgi:hypothetical protein
MNQIRSIFLIAFTSFFISFLAKSSDRSEEIRERMWGGNDGAFSQIETPDKWSDESAIVIAQFNRFEYKKPAVINELYANRYFHNRLKINDKSALNEYTEIKFLSNQGRRLTVYAGFKVIKKDGREILIDPADAVEMEQVEGGEKRAYKKLAIPNLEVGDIIDYYICEDRVIPLTSKIYYFSPVQFHLPQEYPVMHQKLEFNVQRRCFISLRSMNGAPELKMEYDEANEEQNYTLVDEDREAVKDVRWFYPYRELPTIKFRAAYASGKAIRQNDVLLGEPGVVKKEVSEQEISDFVSYLIANSYNDPALILKHVKKNVDKNAGNFEKAKAGYYYHRNYQLQWDEVTTIADKEQWDQNLAYVRDNTVRFLDRFSGFLATSDIPYEIVIVTPRDGSSLDNVLLENELKYLMRVKQGDEYLYLSEIDNFTIPGEISSEYQGAEAYVVDGLADFKDWKLKKIDLPVSEKDQNMSESELTLSLDEDLKGCTIDIERKITGLFKPYHQYVLLDFYDYKEEEGSRYDMRDDFEGTLWMKKRLMTLRESYMSGRDKMKDEYLKSFVDNDYEFEIESVSGLKIDQTGRYDDKPEFTYHFSLKTNNLISKAGGNYLVNIGKLIERQVKIEEEELERKHGIYMDAPRTYKYRISLQIPEGFEVEGLDKLSIDIKTSQGGFVSSASVEAGNLTVETTKYYSNIYAGKDMWPELVKFLNAANQFSEQKILLRKKNS